MDYVGAIKDRVRLAAKAIERELVVSHGMEGVSVAVGETAKSITVTIRVSDVGGDATEEEDPSPNPSP